MNEQIQIINPMLQINIVWHSSKMAEQQNGYNFENIQKNKNTAFEKSHTCSHFVLTKKKNAMKIRILRNSPELPQNVSLMWGEETSFSQQITQNGSNILSMVLHPFRHHNATNHSFPSPHDEYFPIALCVCIGRVSAFASPRKFKKLLPFVSIARSFADILLMVTFHLHFRKSKTTKCKKCI